MMKKIILLLFLVYILGGMVVGQTQEDLGQKPKPSIIVSLEKNKIGINDPLKIVLWISNDSDYDLIDIKLHFSAPDFLKWVNKNDVNSEPKPIKSPYELSKNIAKHTTFRETLYTEINTNADITMGEFNIFFAVEYQWISRETNQMSAAIIKEIIKIDILGTDNIFGIPVWFICFFLPGAILLLILSLFKIQRISSLQRDDKIILSFIASIVVFGLLFGMKYVVMWRFLKKVEINFSISIEKLLISTISGAILGLIIGTLYHFRKWVIKKWKLHFKSIKDSDITHYALLIKKMLDLNPEYKGNAVFVDKDGTQYIGAHHAEFEKSKYLIGTFQIDSKQLDYASISVKPPFDNKKKILKLIKKIACKNRKTKIMKFINKIASKNNYMANMKFIKKLASIEEIEIEIRDTIQKKQPHRKDIRTDKWFKKFDDGGVSLNDPDLPGTQNEKHNLFELRW